MRPTIAHLVRVARFVVAAALELWLHKVARRRNRFEEVRVSYCRLIHCVARQGRVDITNRHLHDITGGERNVKRVGRLNRGECIAPTR